MPIHELLKSQLGLGRWWNRNCRGRIWTQVPKPSLLPVYILLTHLPCHQTQLLTHLLQVSIRSVGQWHPRRGDDWVWLYWHWWGTNNGGSESSSCRKVDVWLVRQLWRIQDYRHHRYHLLMTDSSVRGQMVNSRVRPNSTS